MNWDVFHRAELRLEPGLGAARVREAVRRGELRGEDLARPAGTDRPWRPLSDLPELMRVEVEEEAGPTVEMAAPAAPAAAILDDGPDDRGPEEFPAEGGDGEAEGDDPDPLEEDEEAAEFSLSRPSAERIEELDLAAMVDVAFQMVLFFLVTAATVLYKTLELPAPNPEQKNAAAQGRRTLEDLAKDYILVDIDPAGAIQVDRRPVAAEELIDRLREAREESRRSAMLLSADFATPHRHAVAAYDAANEIGLRIAIARPSRQ